VLARLKMVKIVTIVVNANHQDAPNILLDLIFAISVFLICQILIIEVKREQIIVRKTNIAQFQI
jgi:hypothetical protein